MTCMESKVWSPQKYPETDVHREFRRVDGKNNVRSNRANRQKHLACMFSSETLVSIN